MSRIAAPRWTRRQTGLIAAIVLGVPALVSALAQLGERPAARWDLSLPWGINEFHTENALRFAAAVKRATDGRVDIRVHPGAVLGIKGPDSLRAVGAGVVPMAEMAGFQQVGSEPILGLEALPFLVDDHDELRRLYALLRPAVERAFARHGLKVLYIVPWPNQNLYTKRYAETLAQFEGTKVRTLDANTTELMNRLGLVPIQMPSPDVVPALAAGAIDATMTSTTTGVAQKYWEFLDYIYRTNHNWASNMMVVNEAAWAALAPADRQAIASIASELEPRFWAISELDDKKQLAVLERHGINAVIPPAPMAKRMRAVARPMWRDFVRRVPEAAPILKAYLERTGRPPLTMEEDAAS